MKKKEKKLRETSQEERKKKKKKNRAISFIYLGVFASALCLLGFIIANIVTTYLEINRLEKLNSEIKQDVEILGTGAEGAKDGYFIVYAMNDYVATAENGEIIIVYSIK